MKRRFFNDPVHAHFLTFSCFHRRQFLTNEFARMCLRDSLEYARERHGFALWSYVFMPEHVHLLLYPQGDTYSIGAILRDIKEPPARQVIQRVRRQAPWRLEAMTAHQGRRIVHRLWQAGGGYDRNLFTDVPLRINAIDGILNGWQRDQGEP